MFQKFYTDTLGSRFIKSLLAQTPIPVFDSVTEGDLLTTGCYYVYRDFIIHCVESGLLHTNARDTLMPSNMVYPARSEISSSSARFYVVAYTDEYNRQYCSAYRSNVNHYDSQTHYHLGRYLRYLNTTKNINLMPYYNCFNGTYFPDLELYVDEGKVKIKRVSKQHYKIVGIPVLFGHSYTIALDCPTQILLRACIHDDSGYVEELPGLQNTFQDTARVLGHCSFHNPVTISVGMSESKYAMQERNLYLIIQLPLNNTSSIVVLENYTKPAKVVCNENSVKQATLLNPSLLSINTHSPVAFSNRIIEYLLGNVISSSDPHSKDIIKVQQALSNINANYKTGLKQGIYRWGVWDNNIATLIHDLLEQTAEDQYSCDHDGNINKDVEQILYKAGGTY